MKKKSLIPYFSYLTVAVLILSFLSSCGMASGEAESYAAPKMEARQSGSAMTEFAAETAEAPADFAKSTAVDGVDAGQMPGESTAMAAERKLVSTGSMELVVEDLETAEDSIRESVRKLGGYIASENRWQDSFSMTIKIPAMDFEDFVKTTGGIGEVQSKQIDVQDVTDRYYDLEHRIKNKEVLVERFRSYLEQAEAIEDILEVERQLSDTVTELESLEGSFRNLSHLVSFSTLNLHVRLPSYASDHSPLPSLREGLRNFGYTVVNVFYGIFFVILGIVVFGVPLVLAAGVLYWLGFGKIGVLRKFFRTLRPEGGESSPNGNEKGRSFSRSRKLRKKEITRKDEKPVGESPEEQ